MYNFDDNSASDLDNIRGWPKIINEEPERPHDIFTDESDETDGPHDINHDRGLT
jgi:hypothetical protein